MHDHLPIIDRDGFYTCASGGLGHGLPAAIGIALARHTRRSSRYWATAPACTPSKGYGSSTTTPIWAIPAIAILADGPQNYYRQNVVGGPNAFVLAVEDVNSFAHAMANKLVRESYVADRSTVPSE
jgi:hypothetical protein